MMKSVNPDPHSNDELLITALYHSGDRALMSADLDALSRILADDYIQYDPSGQPFTRQQILETFRTGAVRYPSIVSTGRTIRLFGTTAVVHGSEDDIVETRSQGAAVRSEVRYLYLDVLMKRNGEWTFVASQLAKPEALSGNR
jgi:ketosteroid isomerase-like protein